MTTLNDDDLALAAETALGLLDPAHQAQVNARLVSDPAFAGEVSAWNARLMPMVEGPDVVPPDHVWEAIDASLAPSTSQDNRLTLWKGIAGLSSLAAAIMAYLLFSVQSPQVAPATPEPVLVAALGGPSQPASLAASYDPGSGQLTLTPVALDTGKLYPELWVIPEGGTAHSLGIVRADGPSRISVSAPLRADLAKGSTLAITPEPQGGAPGGKATGAILASGTITTI
jgi:anti-sigma-K factor RskA